MTKSLLLAGAFALAASVASAAGIWTNGVPPAGGTQYPTTIPLTGNETFPADTNLTNGQNPASESISSNQLAGFVAGQPAKFNALIGGDATTNLFQRGTTGASQTTTVAYGGPDRWAYWSGASTAMTVSRDSTASDVPGAFQYAFKMARTSGQTGVVQVCMAQEVASANSYQFQGTTAELDFHAYTGANFSAANANMTAYIVTGTGTDDGMQKLAFGLNAGGGGSSGWTGQANATAAVVSLGAVSTAGRYAAFATIPTTATEIAVALCFTPVGTAGTNDYIAFAGIQLVRNNANAVYASTSLGYSATGVPLSSFERRPAAIEAYYQYTYYQQWADSLAATFLLPETCTETTSGTTAACLFNFPVTMRTTTPTVTVATAGSFGMTKVADGTAEACTTFAVVASTATANGFKATCAASETAAVGTMHIGLYANTGAANTLTVSSEL